MKNSYSLLLRLFLTIILVFFSLTYLFAQVVIKEQGDKTQHREKVPLEYYKPMPLPEGTPRESICPNPQEFITYDHFTKEVTKEPMSPELQKAFDYVPGGKRIDTLNISPETQYSRNFNDLFLISNPENFPWRVNCKVFMTFTDNSGVDHYYVGSGVLIDPSHVLTAGHCVYDYDHGWGWATSVTVKPGWENGYSPYGDANDAQLHTWGGWIASGSWDHDMGVIDLDRPVGALTSWFGYGYNVNSSYYTTNNFNNPGYPAETPYNGDYLYNWYGTFDNVYAYILDFNKEAYGGQSGSGAYIIDGSDRTVHAVLSHGNSLHTGDTRMTASKFSDIQDLISYDTPSTFDLIPLDVNATPSTIATGQSITNFNYLVHNYSSASWNGSVDVDVYLSSNDNISTYDDQISSHSFNSLFTSKSSTRITTTATIPWDKPAGNYYIGVILDISDADPSNNDTDGWDAAYITITEGTLPAPGNLHASDGTYAGSVYIIWNSVSGATHYKVYRNTTNDSGTATDISGWITDPYWFDNTATPGTLYYYWVKAAANASGYASSPFSSYNTGWRRIAAPTGFSASDGTYTDYVNTTWNYTTGGNYYRVYRNTTNDLTTASAVSGWITSNFYNDATAIPGATYYYWVQAAAVYDGSRAGSVSAANSGWRKLSPPGGLTASEGVYNDHVYVEWNSSSGATYYNLYKNTTNNPNTASSVNGWMTGTSFDDYNVTPNQTYYYWVKSAISVTGERLSSFSNSVTGHAGILDCSSSVSLYCSNAYNGNTSSGVNNVSSYNCSSWTESGPEVVHEINVYNTGDLTATLSNLNADLDLFILGSCDNNDCLGSGDLSATYTITTPGLYYIVVDGYLGASGSYTLTITCPPVPENKAVQSVTVYSGQYKCYDATNTITVAGSDAIPFVVQNGGSADFKAGNKIRFLAGTNIMQGAQVNAQITSSYCGWVPAPMMATTITGINDEKQPDEALFVDSENEFFKVYPNPTTGKFIIDIYNPENDDKTIFQIIDLLGNTILLKEPDHSNRYEADLSGYKPGMYIIRVMQGDKAGTKKIIKQ